MAKAADVASGRACKRAGRALIEAGRGRRRKRRTVPQAVASLSGHAAVRYAAARGRACKPRRERGSQSRAWQTCAYPERGERRGLEPAAGVLRPARPRRLKNPPDARGIGSHRTRKQLACATRGGRGAGRTRRARRGTRPSGAGRHCAPVLAPLRRSERAPPGVDPAPDRGAPPNRGRERSGLTRRRRRLTVYGEFYRCLSTTSLTPDRMHSPPARRHETSSLTHYGGGGSHGRAPAASACARPGRRRRATGRYSIRPPLACRGRPGRRRGDGRLRRRPLPDRA